MRELKRCVEAVVQKINMLRNLQHEGPALPCPRFPAAVRREEVARGHLLKKRDTKDKPPMGMYT